MIIGVPKEIKNKEFRVALVPSDAAMLVADGNTVLVEFNAGLGSGFADSDYEAVGCRMVSHDEVYEQCDLLYKVKEIEESEFHYFREGQIIFTYLHSNAHPVMTRELMARKTVAICYEDIDDDNGGFPLLSPMSVLAGKGAFLAGLHFQQSVHGGPGLLLAKIPGCRTPEVLILGCGMGGVGAAELAAGFGCKVTMLDVSKKAMEAAALRLPPNVEFLYSNRASLTECLPRCDLLINCINWPKTRKDHIVYREDLKLMKRGAMVVDMACDDNGALETCRSTTHDDPVFFEEGIMHYCVDNVPSAFSQTASVMLSNVTAPFVKKIAQMGVDAALLQDAHLRRGLTCYYGDLCLLETSEKNGIPYTDALEALGKRVK